jgi:soluble lytic murein transglycosylase-like protein
VNEQAIGAIGNGPADAGAAAARARRLEELVQRAASATTLEGQESFAAALAAASAEAGEGGEGPATPSGAGAATPAATGGTPAAVAPYGGGGVPSTQATAPYAAYGSSGAYAASPAAYGGPASGAYAPSAVSPALPPAAAPYAPTGGTGATLGATRPVPASTPYATLIDEAAARNGVEPALLAGLIKQESGFDPSSRSGAGAMGLTQLMPGTAASLGVAEPYDPRQSIEGGARYLASLLRQFGDVESALAAYNAGAGAVQRYGGVPPYPETRAYVAAVLANARSYGA